MLPPPPCTAAAAVAGLTLALAAAQPGDIVGPILSAHQARDTWQGKVASVLSGKPFDRRCAPHAALPRTPACTAIRVSF